MKERESATASEKNKEQETSTFSVKNYVSFLAAMLSSWFKPRSGTSGDANAPPTDADRSREGLTSSGGGRQERRAGQRPAFVTPPRGSSSPSRDGAARGQAQGTGGKNDRATSGKDSRSAAWDAREADHLDDSRRYLTPGDIPKQLLYGRRKDRFTPEEDEKLVRSLWKIAKDGNFRRPKKWTTVAEECSFGAAKRRTPLELKDRYRILSRNPRLLDDHPDVQHLVVKLNRFAGVSK
jgi:hypothetical protein